MKKIYSNLCWTIVLVSLIIIVLKFPKEDLPFSNDNAIKAIVGEYAQGDLFGMKLYAHAIRNRGTLKGVNGVFAKHSQYESKTIWKLASIAWFESENEIDPTAGASEWRSEDDIENKGWPKGFHQTLFYKDTYFLKPTNNRRVSK